MTTAVRVEALSKRYGSTLAVDRVSFEVSEGEAFGYLGPNGAGKTTTIRCMLGLIRPTEGRLEVLGRDVSTELPAVLAEVGYLPGEFGLWPQMTGRESLDYLGRLHPRPPARREELCERFQLSRRDLDRQVRLYSRGMKQKVGIVQAFQHAPALVVLDEPTEGLDPLMKERFVELVGEHRARGGTTFLSSHILSEVEQIAERVAVLRAGLLVKVGPASDLAGTRVRHCTVVLKRDADTSAVQRLAGVDRFHEDGSTRTFEFRGDMEPLLREMARLPVQEFLCEPERLAESFLELYEEAEEAPPR